jgi:hypothetical protein
MFYNGRRYEIGFYGIETLNKKDMTNEEKLSKALQDFKTKYSSVTSADLQTFIIGWQEAVKNCFIPDVMGELTCDSCGCHPNVIYRTSMGRFCERCKPAS